MRTRRTLALLALSAVMPIACANILGYDEYAARPEAQSANDAGSDVATDAPVDADAEAGDADAGQGPARLPARPTGPIAPSGKGKTLWLVVDHFYLGQESLDGGLGSQPWRQIGLDIDAVCTGPKESKENIGTCLRMAGASQDILTDGDGCRDNNFGSHVVPLVGYYDASFEKTSNELVKKGVSTWLLALEDVDDGPDDPYVVGKLYKAARWADYGATTPKFDGTDVREIDAESVIDGDLAKPKAMFTSGWIAGNTWVSGEPSTFAATVPIQGISVTMPLIGAAMTLKLDDAHTRGTLGALGGALAKTELETVIRPIADQAGLCPGQPLYDSLVKNVSQAFDVYVESPNLQSTSAQCDGLSIGIGFTAVAVQPATSVVATWPTPSGCGDAGSGG